MPLSDRTCILLAGGLGTRLRSAVPDAPKVLAPVLGIPYLTYLLRQVERAGLRRVVLSTGYQGDQVEQAFGRTFGALSLTYSREAEPLGTGGAVRFAWSQAGPGPVLVMNGDSYCDLDLGAFLDAHLAFRGAGTLALAQMADTSRFGRVSRDLNGRIASFAEKEIGAGPGSINAGIYWLEPPLIESIPQGTASSLEREIFPRAVQARTLFGWTVSSRFIDIGTPASYGEAAAFFAEHGAQGSL